jgi:hypothetical protein
MMTRPTHQNSRLNVYMRKEGVDLFQLSPSLMASLRRLFDGLVGSQDGYTLIG